jgi:hypothetical protein
VADWLEQQRGRYTFKAVSAWLVDQFLGLLGARNMTMGQVTYELAGGVRALSTLIDMLQEAASACGLKLRYQSYPRQLGIGLNHPAYWVGIYFDRPEVLVFTTNYRRVNPKTADRLGIGGVFEEKGAAGWRREVNLDSEDVHFFSRSKASQLQFLETFLRECLETVRKIEIPEDRPTEPEADEGV